MVGFDHGCTLITGGNTGIGAAISRSVLDAGGRVLCLSRRPPDFRHADLIHLAVDLADSQAVEKTIPNLEVHGPILRLVHNAGVIRPARLEDATSTDLDYLTQLHLSAFVRLTQFVLPAMKEHQFGRIIGVSSRGALGLATRTHYAATKAGMIGMIRCWALELGGFGITANCIAPGPVESEMFYDIVTSEEQKQKLVETIPVKRVGQPQDVAAAAKFFLSSESGFITGQTLYVCGGASVGSLKI
jgi:3-oxoacyl-[acyl-carrier protein] reductase